MLGYTQCTNIAWKTVVNLMTEVMPFTHCLGTG